MAEVLAVALLCGLFLLFGFMNRGESRPACHTCDTADTEACHSCLLATGREEFSDTGNFRAIPSAETPFRPQGQDHETS